MLLSIAVFPLLAPAIWHAHYGKVAAAWAAVLLIPFVATHGAPALREIARVAVVDYVPFIILLGTLFTIGGGVHLRGTLHGTPRINATLMAIGAALASWVGTTGAAMLLVRPLVRANRERRHRAHTVVFFIFLVANIGGALTPLGDPPLFLGFLHGVPFFWTFSLWEQMLFTAGCVLACAIAVDLFWWRREDAILRDRAAVPHEPLRLEGAHNVVLLAGVVGAVILSGVLRLGELSVLGVRQSVQNLLRDGVLLALLATSWWTTPRAIRDRNDYTWEPIREVAVLFGGIFATIIPALAMLRAGEDGALAVVVRSVREPAHFFWASGFLSSFLDNAPTYLTFVSTALGRLYPGVPEPDAIHRLLAEHPVFLRAIATGSVFMGANTYIGNAPNFMVKSIAEEAGISMPSFFGYIVGYTLPFLIPAFVLATWVFFP
jgi:Na+/H+ antiporter NhaD/arsenite permease-like protein